MSRAEKLLEAAEETLAQSFADGLATRFDQLHLDVDEIEVVVDEETGFVFIEIEQEEESVTLAAIHTEDPVTDVLMVVSNDDESIVIDLEALSPPVADAYIDFSDSSWLTKRVIKAAFDSAKFLSEAVGISQSGGVSQVAVIHRIPKDDDLLVALRDRASELGLDAYIEDEIEDTEIEHIDYPNNIAGSGEWGLYPIETGEEE